MGATIIEKHVGKTTDTISLNDYSCTVEQMGDVIDVVVFMVKSSRGEFSTSQALEQLKRGMYLKYNMRAGDQVLEQDLYYAMPLQEGCLNASNVYDIVGKTLLTDLKGDQPLKLEYVKDTKKEALIEGIKQDILPLLNKAGVTVTHKDDVELSCHFGLDKYRETGALIVSKINRTYCKKIIAMLPNQDHPTHRHLQKEECFELLEGDCTLTLNGRDISLKKGMPILINREVNHSFRSKNGCIIEEVSTTHIKGDSIYEDPAISKLTVDERKVKITL